MYKTRRDPIDKSNPEQQEQSGGVAVPDLRFVSSSEDRRDDQWSRIEDAETACRTFTHRIFDKGASTFTGEETATSTNECWESWLSTCGRMNLDPYLSLYTN